MCIRDRDNIDGYVKVESCKIAQGTGTFSVKASVEEKPASDDDNFYLLKMNMYDTELDAEMCIRDRIMS